MDGVLRRYSQRAAETCVFALLVFLSVGYLAYVTWMRCTDPLVDFGTQLYHASRFANGDWPYRDFATYNGPLSVWINGLWLSIVGESLTALVVLNAVVVTLLGGLLWEALRRTGSPSTCWAAILIFVWLFAFQRLVRNNCFNYLCPYSHEHVHAIVLTSAGLLLLDSAKRRTLWIIAAAWMALATHMPLATATLGLCGSWPLVFHPDIQSLPFFRSSMGTDDILTQSLTVGGAGATAIVPLSSPGRLTRLPGIRGWHALLLSVAVGCVGCVRLLTSAGPAFFLFRGMPVRIVCVLMVHSRSWLEAAKQTRLREQTAWRVALVAMALLMLAKISLNCRVKHYGFILAMPAVVVTGGCFSNGWRSLDAPHTRACGLAILTKAVLSLHFYVFRVLLAEPPVPCGQGRDQVFGDDERAAAVHVASEWLRINTRSQDRVVVLPEGAPINFLSRRGGGRFVNFIPPDGMVFGEDTIVNEFRQQPPAYVLLAPKNMDEWGVRYGETHLRNTLEWLNERCDPLSVVRAPQSSYRIYIHGLR